MILAATDGSNAPESLKDLCFRDLQPTRKWLLKRRWDYSSAVYEPISYMQTYSLLGVRPG